MTRPNVQTSLPSPVGCGSETAAGRTNATADTPRRRRPGRPRRSAADASVHPREEILRHASVSFSGNGIAGTSLTDIARLVGVTPAAIYYHFAGRDQIVAALVSYVVDETDAFAATADGLAAPTDRLEGLIARHVERLTSSPYDLWFVTSMSDTEARRCEGLIDHVSAWRAALRSVLADGVASGDFIDVDPALAVITLSGVVSGALQLHHETGSVDHEVIALLAVRAIASEPAKLHPTPSRPAEEQR